MYNDRYNGVFLTKVNNKSYSVTFCFYSCKENNCVNENMT
jgi:hypothetical protein